ncbi:M48 family metalloprotease [Candidatus Woesearchaeota archaeon]|nr:M48 family metalloprotease [Candidatus Woesearchaeota archaeon]
MWNQIKTVLLLGLLTGVLLYVGTLLGGLGGLTVALIFSIVMNVGAYFFSHKIVLAMYKATLLDKKEYPKVHAMVEDIARAARIPTPKIYLIRTPQPNAFATGPHPKKAVVAVTAGILQLLSDHELKGVLAHEIAHIKNRDILISTIAATLAGVISYVAMIARWGAIFGFGGRDSQGGRGIIELLLLAIVTPIIALLIQLAISRSREYLADASGASYIGTGEYLANALIKIEKGVKQLPFRASSTTESTAHLFISNPLKGGGLTALFSTHPSTTDRVTRLRAMQF